MNQHKHTKACRKYQSSCRFSFPKYPVWKTLITDPNSTVSVKEKTKYEKILKDVQDVLTDDSTVNKIMQEFDKKGEVNWWNSSTK